MGVMLASDVPREFWLREAVPGMGSSSSESGNGVGLMSSKPVLEGRDEGVWPL